MDKKKIKECVKELQEKITYLNSLLDGEEKKEVSSLDELRDKANESEEKEDY